MAGIHETEVQTVQTQPSEQDSVLTRGVYMSFVGDNPHGGVRGRAWHYTIDRFQRDERIPLPIPFDKYEGLEMDPRTGLEIPSGIRFKEYPKDKTHHWAYDQVNGLVVPTLRAFVDRVNGALDEQRLLVDRNRVLRSKLGPNVGIILLSHLDRAADHFLQIASAGTPED